MMKKKIFLAITLLISTYGFGQISNVQDVRGVPIRTGSFDYVEGSPYIDGGEWKLGSITNIDGKVYNNAQIRFNGYTNELEYVHKGNGIIVAKEMVKAFEFNVMNLDGSSERYAFASGYQANDDIEESDFVRVIYAGDNFSIIQKVFKEKTTVTPAAYGESDYEKFIENDIFYVISADQANNIKLNKKNFYEVFSEHKEDIKAFIKKNRVNFNDFQDVKDLAQYIDKGLLS